MAETREHLARAADFDDDVYGFDLVAGASEPLDGSANPLMLHKPPLDLSEPEGNVLRRLRDATDVTEDVQDACYYLAGILGAVFTSLEKGHPWRGWDVDDLACDEVVRRDSIVTLRGASYWLCGGVGCVWFQVDVALGHDPLLYSYKFFDAKRRQVLYVGKTPDGWQLNGTT